MESQDKVRRIRFWAGANKGGTMVTASNKKALREKIEPQKEMFKGTKIRQFEVHYEDHADLALKLMGANMDSLAISGYAKVISEYDA